MALVAARYHATRCRDGSSWSNRTARIDVRRQNAGFVGASGVLAEMGIVPAQLRESDAGRGQGLLQPQRRAGDIAAGQACDQCDVEQVPRYSSGVGPAVGREPESRADAHLVGPTWIRGEAEPAGMLTRASTCLPSVSSLAVTNAR